MSQDSSFWDAMAKDYPRYNDSSIMHDAKIIFEKAVAFGIDFKGKTLLDIGCGSGTLAIPLAKKAQHITAIDISKPMLEVFQKDKEALNLQNKIKIYHSSWDDYSLNDRFDIVLASMTGGVSKQSEYAKFIEAAKIGGIFVGWGGYKDNDIIDKILQRYKKQKTQNLQQARRFANYLKAKDIKHRLSFFETSWSNSYSFEKAFNYASSHLQRVGVDLSSDKILKVLQDHSVNGNVTFTTKAQKGVVVFTK